MRNIIMTSLILLAIHVPVRAAELPDAYAKALADAARTVPAIAKRGHFTSRSPSLYEKLGSNLASKFPKTDIQFLEARITNKNKSSAMTLAWVMLAKLADRKEARDVVMRHCFAGQYKRSRFLAILSLSFMPAAARKDMAETIATQQGYWHSRRDMFELLGYIGDGHTVELLSKIAKQDWSKDNREAATKALEFLQAKMKQSVPGQKAWAQAGVRFWRACREVEARFPDREHVWAAEQVANSGVKCPASFLRRHMIYGDLAKRKVIAGDIMAIVLAGVQKEPELTTDLDRIASGSSGFSRRVVALNSLARIGNKAAMDIVYKQMKPGDTKWNDRIAQILTRYGTKSDVAMLTKLSKDKKYKASWPVFKEWLERLKGRLERKQREPKSQPSTKPAS